MAYDRYDRWRGREERSGYGDDPDRRDWGSERYRERERDERGFFERAGDEIASWFGDEEAERRRMRDERRDERMRGRDYERGSVSDREEGWFSSGHDDDRDYGRGRAHGRDYERYERGYAPDRGREQDRPFMPMGWTTSNRDYREDYRRGNERSARYRPMTGDYSRGSDEFRYDRGSERDFERRDYGRASEWERDPYRQTSFAGSSARSGHEDRPYDEWRRRHMDELDRDYDEYRRENQSRFENDFGEWRQRREGKRQLLDRIREHMEVVGSDGEHVGTVDRIAGDRIILTRSDPESGGAHHSVSCTMIDRVDDDRVILEMSADRARERWLDEDHDRALFEREDQGEAGPGMLNRSFSGTYR